MSRRKAQTSSRAGRADSHAALRSLFAPAPGESLWLVAATAVASVVLGLALGTLLISRVVPLILGWDVTAVTGASMGPDINTGDLVAFRGTEDIRVGQIIVFESQIHEGETTVHRVVGQWEDGSFVTKGDASASEDSTPVPAEAVRGVVTMVAPFAGYPSIWMTEGSYLHLGLLLGAILASVVASVPAGRRVKWPLLKRPPIEVSRLRSLGGGVPG